MIKRQFKVMVDWRHPEIKHAASVPWDIVAPHETQAKRNHYQTLERLNERGGLGVVELWHVVNDQDWTGKLPCGARVTFEEAVDWLKQLLASREPLPEPVESTQPQTGHSPAEGETDQPFVLSQQDQSMLDFWIRTNHAERKADRSWWEDCWHAALFYARTVPPLQSSSSTTGEAGDT